MLILYYLKVKKFQEKKCYKKYLHLKTTVINLD